MILNHFIKRTMPLIILLLIASVCFSQTQAPLNPEFVKYMGDYKAGKLKLMTDEGYPLGEIPPTFILPKSTVKKTNDAVPPSSYDLRIASPARLTGIRNQLSCGSCWSFATFGSLESCQQTQAYSLAAEPNYSENNLKNLNGFDRECCSGGNNQMSTAYLVRWDGPIYESDDSYNGDVPNLCSSTAGLTVRKHIQDVIWIPARGTSGNTDIGDNTALKNAVMDYGAVYVSMQWSNTYYNSTNKAYYRNGTVTDGGHAICIVGWDDDFAASNFTATPAGNGAFLVRNSWGTTWGYSGYFYVSYYDNAFGRSQNAVFHGFESPTNYSKIFQYDPLGCISSLGYGDNDAYCANVFTSPSNASLQAVGTYALANGTSYEVKIYKNVASTPDTGTLVATKSGTFATAGYHTVVLDSPISLTSGEVFAVAFYLNTPSYNYPLPMEYKIDGFSSSASASAGQSYTANSSTSWEDLKGFDTSANICIKAYAGSASSTQDWEKY